MAKEFFTATTTHQNLSAIAYGGHQIVRNLSTSDAPLKFKIGAGSTITLQPGTYHYWADSSGFASEIEYWRDAGSGTVRGKFATFGSAGEAQEDGGGDA